MRQFFQAPKSYVKAKHKTQELPLSTRQRNAVLVGWADF